MPCWCSQSSICLSILDMLLLRTGSDQLQITRAGQELILHLEILVRKIQVPGPG